MLKIQIITKTSLFNVQTISASPELQTTRYPSSDSELITFRGLAAKKHK